MYIFIDNDRNVFSEIYDYMSKKGIPFLKVIHKNTTILTEQTMHHHTGFLIIFLKIMYHSRYPLLMIYIFPQGHHIFPHI